MNRQPRPLPLPLTRSRRAALGLALGGAALLGGCGFELRREPEMQFRSLALRGFSSESPLAAELRRQLGHTSAQLVADANRAEVVLEVSRDQRERVVVASSVGGQVSEWQLRLNVDYRLVNAAGDVLVPRTEMRLSRDMNYSESAALAKEQEEALLYRAMTSDAASLLMRRLSAVRPRPD